MRFIQSIIKDICMRRGIECSLVSKDWIMVLRKQNKTRYITGYKFDLNDHAVGQICDDKYALYDVIRNFSIPVVEHFILFRGYDREEALEYAKKYQYNVVVKSNTGTCGGDMYHTLSQSEFLFSIDHLLEKNSSISICPYYLIKHEYRAIFLNGKVELFYGKKKPVVFGNGKDTIYELLCNFNEYYFSRLSENQDFKRVLKSGEVYEYNWQFNLSKGAVPFFVLDPDLEKKISQLALRVAQILNLRFASIDVVELESGEILVLEVNSGVMMENFSQIVENGRDIATRIYEKAIEEMFR